MAIAGTTIYIVISEVVTIYCIGTCKIILYSRTTGGKSRRDYLAGDVITLLIHTPNLYNP